MLMIVIMTIIKIITTTINQELQSPHQGCEIWCLSIVAIAILTTTKTYDNYVCFRGTINLTFSRVDYFPWVAVDADDS